MEAGGGERAERGWCDDGEMVKRKKKGGGERGSVMAIDRGDGREAVWR